MKKTKESKKKKINQSISLEKIFARQRQFAKEREWEKFHTPKNVASALAVEAGELLEIFQWLNENESKNIMKKQSSATKVRHEIADIFYWICRLADLLEVPLEEVFFEKMLLNEKKYPISHARGNARKYTEFKLSVQS